MMSCKSMLGSCGLMDKASDFGSEDCRFESCHDRKSFFLPFRAIKKEAYVLISEMFSEKGKKKREYPTLLIAAFKSVHSKSSQLV